MKKKIKEILPDKFCLKCGKKLIVRKWNYDRKKFCSRQCLASYNGKKLWKTEEFRKKMALRPNTPEINDKKAHRLDKHPNWKGGDIKRLCVFCGKEFYVNHHKAFTHPDKERIGKFCSKKCMHEYQKIHPNNPKTGIRVEISCKVCGKKVMVLPYRSHQKTCSVRCSGVLGMLAQKMEFTSIEKKVATFLDRLNCKYRQQVVVLNLTRPDFELEDGSLIYADGDYWHSLPKTRSRDAYINKMLKQANIRTLRISESLINNGEYENIIRNFIGKEYSLCQVLADHNKE